jgi:hypothetical protein
LRPAGTNLASTSSLLHVVSKIRESPAHVLVTGETGASKEVLARHLHAISSQSQQPVRCHGLRSVAEAFQSQELFGIEAGTLPGVEERIGRFEKTVGGTLLLDEVGHMSGVAAGQVAPCARPDPDRTLDSAKIARSAERNRSTGSTCPWPFRRPQEVPMQMAASPEHL